MWIIFSVIIIAIIIGIIVTKFAKMGGRLYIEKKTGIIRKVGTSDKSLTSAIWQQISKLPGPVDSQRKAAEAITELFTGKLDKEVDSLKQDLSKKYEKTIDEVKQTAEIVEKKYEKLSIEKKQTESVIRSIAEGLVVVNEKGEVLLMNPAAERLLKIKKEEKVGKPISENLKDEQLISLMSGSSDKEGKEIELTSGKDETKKVLRASSAVIENEYGKTVGMVSVLSDVTKQRQLEQMKADFISKISHELRMPIVTAQNSISLLLSKVTGSLSPEQEKFLTITQRNLNRLGMLIDDILDLSKLEAAKIELQLKPCSIEKLVSEVCENLTPWAKTKAIKIEKMIPEKLPEINADADKIIQVLNNIIGNAVKFTPHNGRVAVEAGIDKKNKNMLVTNVTDTGVGIAKENLDKVFDKFQQVGERVATDISGTGLGLAIAKEIVKLHGGEIWAESEKGQGAKFFFTLPIAGNNKE